MDSLRGVTLVFGLLVTYCLLGCHVTLGQTADDDEPAPGIIDLTAASSEIEEGESISLECEVENLGFGNGVGWKRINPAVEATPAKTVSLAYSSEVESDVPERYKASLKGISGKPTRGLAKLSVTPASAQDSGTYLCEIKGGTTKVSRSIEITVLVLPKNGSVSFKQGQQELTNGGDASFGRNQKGKFECSVASVYPKPSVQIVIGQTVIGSDAVYVAETSEDASGSANFKRTLYSATVTVEDVTIESEYNGKQLECQIKVGTQIPNVVGVKLSVAHPPRVYECKPTSAQIGAKEVTLECKFEGDPKPKVTWKLPGTGQILSADGTSQIGAVTASEKKTDKGYTAQLKIIGVAQQDFGKYEVSAEQDGETSKGGVTLTEIKKQTAKGSASTVTWSLLCMLVTMLVSVRGC